MNFDIPLVTAESKSEKKALIDYYIEELLDENENIENFQIAYKILCTDKIGSGVITSPSTGILKEKLDGLDNSYAAILLMPTYIKMVLVDDQIRELIDTPAVAIIKYYQDSELIVDNRIEITVIKASISNNGYTIIRDSALIDSPDLPSPLPISRLFK